MCGRACAAGLRRLPTRLRQENAGRWAGREKQEKSKEQAANEETTHKTSITHRQTFHSIFLDFCSVRRLFSNLGLQLPQAFSLSLDLGHLLQFLVHFL